LSNKKKLLEEKIIRKSNKARNKVINSIFFFFFPAGDFKEEVYWSFPSYASLPISYEEKNQKIPSMKSPARKNKRIN
jgi:hypothetical protein